MAAKRLKKEQREAVWLKFGKHCAYCGKKLRYKELQVDHLVPRLNGMVPEEQVEHFDNYMPSCRRCNHYKRADSLENFREKLKTLHKRLMRQYLDKVAKDYGIIEVTPFEGTFFYETYNPEDADNS